jgi:hypothetical protein
MRVGKPRLDDAPCVWSDNRMKRSTVVFFLLGVCVLQSVQVARQGVQVTRQWREVHGLENPQRRLRLWGEFYSEIMRVESQIPKTAVVRWQSKEFPWYSAYYLYPRLLTPAGDPKKAWTLRYEVVSGRAHMEAKAL